MRSKTLFPIALIVLVLASLAVAQVGRFPTTPPTFPQQKPDKDLVDINAASKEQLLALPGVDNSSAEKIIENRPYKKKNELKKRKIVCEETYKQISDRITVTPPKK